MNQREQLEQAKREIKVATLEDIRIPKGVNLEELTTYLKDFAKPTGICWHCKENLVVEWGIQHGIAHCVSCRADVKVYHYIRDEKGVDKRIEAYLQWHPSCYETEEEAHG